MAKIHDYVILIREYVYTKDEINRQTPYVFAA